MYLVVVGSDVESCPLLKTAEDVLEGIAISSGIIDDEINSGIVLVLPPGPRVFHFITDEDQGTERPLRVRGRKLVMTPPPAA